MLYTETDIYILFFIYVGLLSYFILFRILSISYLIYFLIYFIHNLLSLDRGQLRYERSLPTVVMHAYV